VLKNGIKGGIISENGNKGLGSGGEAGKGKRIKMEVNRNYFEKGD
jgi:hypothetical protein